MNGFRLDRFLELLTSPTLVWGTVAGGFAVLAIALVVLMMTRFGQSHPLGKSAILSVFTHVLLAFWMSSMQFAAVTYGSPDGEVEIGVVDPADSPTAADGTAAAAPSQPWDRFDHGADRPTPRPAAGGRPAAARRCRRIPSGRRSASLRNCSGTPTSSICRPRAAVPPCRSGLPPSNRRRAPPPVWRHRSMCKPPSVRKLRKSRSRRPPRPLARPASRLPRPPPAPALAAAASAARCWISRSAYRD